MLWPSDLEDLQEGPGFLGTGCRLLLERLSTAALLVLMHVFGVDWSGTSRPVTRRKKMLTHFVFVVCRSHFVGSVPFMRGVSIEGVWWLLECNFLMVVGLVR